MHSQTVHLGHMMGGGGGGGVSLVTYSDQSRQSRAHDAVIDSHRQACGGTNVSNNVDNNNNNNNNKQDKFAFQLMMSLVHSM